MKIVDVRVLMHQRPMRARLAPPTFPLGVLSIVTDEGVEGHTFFGLPEHDIGPVLATSVKQMLVGANPLDIGRIWRLLSERRLPVTAQGAVDVALWDIAGKAAGLPVHRLLGTARDRVPVYSSSWVHFEPEHYVEEALSYQSQGFRGHKIHPLTQLRAFVGTDTPVSADIDLCHRLRAAVGLHFPLFLDAGWEYDYGEAVRVGREIDNLGFEWFEDPLEADDLYGYIRLKQQLSIPIMATEITPGGLTGLAPWVEQRATDFLRGDVVLKGGITGMMKIAHLAEAFHLNCEVHDAYNALNNLASLHVIMAIENCDWFEVLVVHEHEKFDLDHLNYGLVEPIPIDTDGYARAPERPGLGIDIDWDRLKRSAVEVSG
ncbi:enolase C-terminal domain-like protein [Mycobacterium sp. 1465703.0]|uniref:enolase C-terminal domain-like protein n=1 Tax=Mycobacterium sp. 1465703.0 TaxID=1834078 RepID=UPI0007FD7EFE|nr:enolase C-terminal domain-like protein [Mycobacterium sp. 1465703.0]OBJ01021.1 hypothetical protein A5625_25935 [Mycobacterium sp. 1465703.0]